MNAQAIADVYQQDLVASENLEFPISVMSRRLAFTVEELVNFYNLQPRETALDAGSGSGIQSAVISSLGYKNILGIDISEQAVIAAERRYESLILALEKLSGHETAHPSFEWRSIDDSYVGGDKYDLIVTNPPSFFCGRIATNALEFGLFDGNQQDAEDIRKSYLYRFFSIVVASLLKPNGTVICVWPGLEWRLVHDLGQPGEEIVHPVKLLRKWFNWSFENDDQDWKAFYQFETSLSDYGLGPAFVKEVADDLKHGGIYSGLVRLSANRGQPKLTFKFGILALKWSNSKISVLSIPVNGSGAKNE